MLAALTLIVAFIGVNCQDLEVIPVKDPKNIVLAFGSCNNLFESSETVGQTLQSITKTNPDLWMWLGDAIYLDGKDTTFLGIFPGPEYDITDPSYIQNMFNQLKTFPAYVELRTNTPIIGTWDDHDSSFNNQGKSFPYKQRNMGFYLDFLDVPVDSPRRSQEGVYTSYYIGEDKLIKVILLDTRYNRDSEPLVTRLIGIDVTKRFDDMLGDQQWTWLESQLQDQTSLYTLIVSSSQFMPDDRPLRDRWYEDSQKRLYDMINARKKSGIVFLSGDVHYAEILTHPCPRRVGYKNLYEFTSSGMTHYSNIAEIFDDLNPKTYSRKEDRYFGRNFGVLRFKQVEGRMQPPNLVFEARNEKGEVVLLREIAYSDLMYDQSLADGYNGCEDTDTDDGIF